jgi:hypothetical protein
MTTPSQHSVDELLKYFWPYPYPQHLPPTTVTFHNGLPLDNNDTDHMLFQMSYNTFRTAIEAEKRAYALEARIEELDRLVFEETGISDVERFEYQNDGAPMLTIQPPYVSHRIAELRSKAKLEEK